MGVHVVRFFLFFFTLLPRARKGERPLRDRTPGPPRSSGNSHAARNMRRPAVKDGGLGQALFPLRPRTMVTLGYTPYTCQIHMQGHERRKQKRRGEGRLGGFQSLGTPNDDQTTWERRSLVFVRGKWML